MGGEGSIEGSSGKSFDRVLIVAFYSLGNERIDCSNQPASNTMAQYNTEIHNTQPLPIPYAVYRDVEGRPSFTIESLNGGRPICTCSDKVEVDADGHIRITNTGSDLVYVIKPEPGLTIIRK